MSRYVIIASHSPDLCPTANATVRAKVVAGMSELKPILADSGGVTFVLEPIHLDPSHRTIAVVDAPKIEAVTKFVADIGLTQWNEVEIWPARSTSELFANLDEVPPLFS
jgi:hypothetical protein